MIRSDSLVFAGPATRHELDRLREVGQDDLLGAPVIHVLSDFGGRPSMRPSPLGKIVLLGHRPARHAGTVPDLRMHADLRN